MPRKHPLFPTRHEVKAQLEDKSQKNEAYSDHLPVLTRVPMGEGKSSLNIVSLNILGGENCSGIHPYPLDEETLELLESFSERYRRITEGVLAKSIQKHGVDVILLQESSEHIVEHLQKNLGEDWDIIVDNGLISCYNKKRLKLGPTNFDNTSRIRSMTFSDLKNDLTVDVHNIWGNYTPFPQHLEKQCNEKLIHSDSDVSAIMGDTNSRIAPLDNRKRNLTTGIVPGLINAMEGEDVSQIMDLQVTDHPDGGFYRSTDGRIHQLETETLSFETAEIIRDDRSEEEMELYPDFRMIMCLDSHYHEQAIINGKTIFAYEKELQDKLGDNCLLVRMASDSYNNKAVAIRFPKNTPAFKFIKEKTKEEAGFQFHSVNPTYKEDGFEPQGDFIKVQNPITFFKY